MELARIDAALRAAGLTPRGAFHPGPDDGVPALAVDTPVATIVLAGNVGPDMWRAFAASREAGDGPDPLDRWTKRVLDAIAAQFRGHALYPFGGPPYLPFQRWAQRAEPVSPSPIGPLIHPDYGLWHAYRGALALADRLEIPPIDRRISPCESCVDRPCLATCPAGAFSPDAYDVAACARHLTTPAGDDCMTISCRARRACPIGQAYAYETDQAYFHMDAFLRNRRPQ